MAGENAGALSQLEQIECRPIVVASHPRSGTHLCIDTLRLNFAPCRSWKLWFERADRLYLNYDALALGDRPEVRRLASRVITRADRPILKTHADADLSRVAVEGAAVPLNTAFGNWLNRHAHFIYMYRDGREVMRSLYQYMQPRPEADVPFSQFIRQKVNGMSRARIWAHHVRSWMARPRTIAISMEALTGSTENVLSQIAAATGLPALHGTPKLPPRCEDEFFSRLWRRIASAPKSTAIVSNPRYEFYRHWREAFAKKADREFFHQEAGDVLVELGYESSDSWVDDEVDPTVHRDSRAWRGGEHRGDASFSPSDSQAAALSMCQVKVR